MLTRRKTASSNLAVKMTSVAVIRRLLDRLPPAIEAGDAHEILRLCALISYELQIITKHATNK